MFAPSPGTLIAGKYRVERTLGAGGMGLVLAATHLELEQLVAIKVLLPHAMADEDFVTRFAREGKLAAKITSDHVARVLDVGKTEDGTPYMVMEYLEGEDLMALSRRGPLPVEDAVEYVLHALDAVGVAHALGIVHRDLKPANLFLTKRADGSPSVKVLDFGISKVIGGTSDGNTTGMIGSPIYMSPEQMMSSRDVDARSDIWSIGAILFRLVSGKPPYDAENVIKLATIISSQPPASLRGFRPDVAPAFEAVVVKCLARDRADRYANVQELAGALRPFASPRALLMVDRIEQMQPGAVGLSLPPSGHDDRTIADASLEARGETLSSQTTDPRLPLTSTRTTVVAALVAFAVALSAIGGGMLWRRRSHAAPPTAASTSIASAAPSASASPLPPVSAAVTTTTAVASAAPSTTTRKGPLPRIERPGGTAAPTKAADAGDSWGWQR